MAQVRASPGLDLDIAPSPPATTSARVADGAVDLAVGVFDALPASLYRRALYEDRLACVLRAAIPTPPPWTWMATWRCAIAISGVGASPVDAALSARGHDAWRCACLSWPPP